MNFPRMNFSKRLLITLAILAILLLLAFFVFNSKIVVKAQNQIKIFPTSYTLESSNDITWQNPQNAFNQDLPDNASFADFNEENSAFIKGIIEEETTTTTVPSETAPITESTTTTLPSEMTTTTTESTTTTTIESTTTTTTLPLEETTTTTIPQETTTTTEPISWLKKIFGFLIPKVNAEEEKQALNSASLIFENFSLPEGFDLNEIQNVQLRISLAGKGQEGDKVIINYFYQNEWRNLEELDLSQEIFNNTNGGYFLYALPIFENPEDLQNLKIKFTYYSTSIIPDSKLSPVYLDSVWLDLEYGEVIKIESKIGKHDWKISEEPEFDFSEGNNTFLSHLKSLMGRGNIQASLITPDNKETKEGIIVQGNKVKVTKQGATKYRPGLYKLRIKKGDQIIIQEFSWGVLAININKSIYLPNETAYLQMAVLKDDGHTVCDARLELRIKNHESKIETILLTADGTIKYSGKCGPNNVTDIPDYFAFYQVEEPGNYEMKLTNLDNGYEILDSFEVRDSVSFEIERIGPTRIYPPATYEMTLKIKANQDFNGEIIENVPTSFDISIQNTKYRIQNTGQDQKSIVWEVDWKIGKEYELSYTFDAPDISPYIYLLGPLQIGDPSAGSGQSFKEIRQWQIAADQVANLILLWDPADGTIPTDWTCISCSGGQDFYQKFICGEASYGTPSGTATHIHSTSGPFTSSSTASFGGAGGSPKANYPPLAAHTHTASLNTSGLTGSNLPAYRNFKVIRYDYGIPSSLPQNIIAIFDTSPPVGWATSTYNDNKYIQGENTAGTGGSNSHTQTVTLNSPTNTAAASATSAKACTSVYVGAANHSHTITSVSNTCTSGSGNNEPPYQEVYLAKKDSAGAIPSNMIAMFDNTPPAANWTVNSGSGQTFYQKFFKPTGGSGVGGNTAHSHTSCIISVTTDNPNPTVCIGTAGSIYGSQTHTHTFSATVNFQSVSHLPPYNNAIFAKAGATTPTPNLEQIHYHWRNDNGNEETASSATSGSEDTTYDTFFYTDNKRIRIEISNEGTAAAENVEFRLEYGLKETTCLAISSWIDVDAVGGDWDMYDTTNFPIDGANTTNIATSTGGVTDANSTWKTPNYGVKDTSSQVATTTLTYEDFMEMEFSIKPSTSSGTYCFRITNASVPTNFTYTRYPETTLTSNEAPVVSNVKLNNQVNINLIENTTTSTSATAAISDSSGCSTITNVLAKIYRSSVSGAETCTANENNCYSVASCTQNTCSGTDATYTCPIDMQFHADPTDGSAEYWRAWVEATDGSLSHSTTSPADAPDVNTLRALNVTATIDYGTLDPGQNTTSTNQQITVTNTGNAAIDVRLYGADMTWNGNTIDTANQEYSLSLFAYGAGNDLKESPSYDDVNVDLPKPTQSPSTSSDIFYWGLGVPSPMPSGGPYQGTNTFEAITAIGGEWVLNETTCNALDGWAWYTTNGRTGCWSKTLADSVSWNKGVGNVSTSTGSYTCTSLGTYDLQTRMTAAAAGEWYKIASEINSITITSSHNASSGYAYISALAISDCIDGTKDLSDCGASCIDWGTTNTWLRTWAGEAGKSALPYLATNAGTLQTDNDYWDACSQNSGYDTPLDCTNNFYLNRKLCDDGDTNYSWAAACGSSDGFYWGTYARLLGANSCSHQDVSSTSNTNELLSFRVVVRP